MLWANKEESKKDHWITAQPHNIYVTSLMLFDGLLDAFAAIINC